MDFEKLQRIQQCRVLVFGDMMIDKYIMGDVSRISPEAPVPIVRVTTKQEKLGGAGNVINNVVSLGGKIRILGCVGEDSDGQWIQNTLKERGIDTTYIRAYPTVQTISKTRLISKNQQFLRFDEECVQDIPPEYQTYIETQIEQIFADVDVVILSDYGKGAVTPAMAQLLITEAKKRTIPVVVDPKGNDYKKYSGATACTPNLHELRVVTGKKAEDEAGVLEAGLALMEQIDLQYLMLTRSEKGISLFQKGSAQKQDFPAVGIDVVDVTGAGDTVVSTVALLLACGYSPEECITLSNFAASVVCSKFGAATLSLNELMESVSHSGQFKLIDESTAQYVVRSLQEKGKKVVFTNGCFDLLHVGHLSSFLQAKCFGDALIVAVNSDASVRSIKGDLRPVIREQDRLRMICALECVDYVILMQEKDPSSLLAKLKPDIAVKGEDWRGKYMPEREIVEGYGGKMEFISLNPGHSTTTIIDRIRKAYGE